MARIDPVLGLRQPFPTRCHECRERLRKLQDVVMIPVVVEGEPRWEGRVLWAVWVCESCAVEHYPMTRWLCARAQLKQPDPEDSEPSEVRYARLEAERDLNRQALAAGRANAVNRARRRLDEIPR